MGELTGTMLAYFGDGYFAHVDFAGLAVFDIIGTRCVDEEYEFALSEAIRNLLRRMDRELPLYIVSRYKEGIDTYLAVLVAQRTLYTARQTLTQTRLDRAQNLVALYLALGGDPLIDDMPVTTPVRAAGG